MGNVEDGNTSIYFEVPKAEGEFFRAEVALGMQGAVKKLLFSCFIDALRKNRDETLMALLIRKDITFDRLIELSKEAIISGPARSEEAIARDDDRGALGSPHVDQGLPVDTKDNRG